MPGPGQAGERGFYIHKGIQSLRGWGGDSVPAGLLNMGGLMQEKTLMGVADGGGKG